MLLVTDLAILKLFHILNFSFFFKPFFLAIVSEIFAHVLNVYEPKYKK
jgi:hypothetical protein